MTANHILHVTPRPGWIEWNLECIGGVGTGDHVLIKTDPWFEEDIDDYKAQGLVNRERCWAVVCLDDYYPTDCIPRDDEANWPTDGPWPVAAHWDGDAMIIRYAGGDS